MKLSALLAWVVGLKEEKSPLETSIEKSVVNERDRGFRGLSRECAVADSLGIRRASIRWKGICQSAYLGDFVRFLYTK